MAKIAFSKLGAKTNQRVNTVTFNNCEIEVKEYLEMEEKLDMISDIVNGCIEENIHFYNPGKVEVYEVLYVIERYTNITFTEKQKENLPKLYDSIVSSGLAKNIISAISDEELNTIAELLKSSLNNIYSYRNSIAGILEQFNLNQDELNLDIEEVVSKITNNPEAITLLRNLNASLG